MRRRTSFLFVGAVAALAALAIAGRMVPGPWHEPGGDSEFDTRVAHPQLAGIRPRVLFDHGHRNSHSISGRYRAFADLVRADGCRIEQTRAAFDAGLLRDVQVLVIVNAKGPGGDGTDPAFRDTECEAIENYVREGGSLLLVADHHPCGEAAARLAARFGVQMSGGWTDDSTKARPGSGDPGQLLFTRADGGLGDHPILRGGPEARVDTVETFTGQSLLGPEGSAPLLLLSPTSMDRVPVAAKVETQGSKRITTFQTADHSAAGRNQGLALAFGRGRVVVLGEAAMLTAQRSDRGVRFGMNAPGNGNRAFTLNVMRWLAHGLDG